MINKRFVPCRRGSVCVRGIGNAFTDNALQLFNSDDWHPACLFWVIAAAQSFRRQIRSACFVYFVLAKREGQMLREE